MKFLTKAFSLLVLFVFSQSLAAQKQAFPEISTSKTEHWYVIKSKALLQDYLTSDYSISGGFVAKGDGTNSLALDCPLATAPVRCTDTWTDEVSKWKIVLGSSKGTYGIVCKKNNKDHYLQEDMQVSTKAFTNWQIREFEAGGASGFAISLTENGKKDFSNLTFARSDNSLGLIKESNTSTSVWSFVPAQATIKPSTKNEKYWYAFRNLSLDERYNRFLSADNNSGLIEGTEIPTQLWAFIPHKDGFLMQNKNGLYISMKTIGTDKMLATDEIKNAAVMQIGEVYQNEKAAVKIYQGSRQSATAVLHMKDVSNFFSVMSSWLIKDNASYWELVGENELVNLLQDRVGDKIDYASKLMSVVENVSEKTKSDFKTQIDKVSNAKSGVKSVDDAVRHFDELDIAIKNFQKNMDLSSFISTEERPLWFFIYSNTDKFPNYKEVVISTSRIRNGHATLEIQSGKDEHLWRFEKDENSNRVKIINKANGQAINRSGVLSKEGEFLYLLPLSDGSFNISAEDFIPLGVTNIGLSNFPGQEKSMAAWRIVEATAGDMFRIEI